MSSILDTIVEQTSDDLRKRKREISLSDLSSMAGHEKRRFSFQESLKRSPLAVIAEVKKASPSRGVIRQDFDPLKLAEAYIEGGAAALSVLTDSPFFRGSLAYLEDISNEFDIPLLRKDFIIDPYQVSEARAYGADAVLLIASITSGEQLTELLHATEEEGLEALVECYSQDEVEALEWEHITMFGVNNRDLHTFTVDLHRGVELLKMAPSEVIRVSESGLSKPEDLKLLTDNEIHAALIGEYFMRQPEPGHALREMLDQLDHLQKGTEQKETEFKNHQESK